MEINFAITEINRTLLPKYSYAAVDGELTISIDNTIIFNEPYILLLEFAFSFDKWLNSNERNFIYDSIDHDEPILAFSEAGNELYSFSSIWAAQPLNRLISLKEIKIAFTTYATSLVIALHQKHNLILTGNLLMPEAL